jgi:hypothetical protein
MYGLQSLMNPFQAGAYAHALDAEHMAQNTMYITRTDGWINATCQAAIRMKAKGVPMRAGDHVPYVICADASATSFAQRAWDPESVEMAKGALSIDKNWYLESQLHPVISRLCAVIEGTDAGRLAECLGLDQAKFNRSSGQQVRQNTTRRPSAQLGRSSITPMHCPDPSKLKTQNSKLKPQTSNPDP